MTKEEIAGVLEQIATLLELKNENPFKIRAYTNAARAVETFGGNISNFQDEEALSKIPGIGKSTRLNSSHVEISYAVFCLKKKKKKITSYQIEKKTITLPSNTLL